MRAVNGVMGSKRRILDRARHPRLGVSAHQVPLAGVLGQQADPLGELALGRVHAAHEHVEHEVDELGVGELVAFEARRDQGRDEVVAGVFAAPGNQSAGVVVELGHGLLDPLALGHQRGAIELALDPVRPFVQARGVAQRRAHHRGDGQRRIGLGERLHELAAARVAHAVVEPLEEPAHCRAPALGRARRERGVDQVAQPAVVVGVDVQDVADDLLVQGAVLDAE
jgi:hypothetical protein